MLMTREQDITIIRYDVRVSINFSSISENSTRLAYKFYFNNINLIFFTNAPV